jgi:RNA polymerase sigma-70 factor, ECF subfamily
MEPLSDEELLRRYRSDPNSSEGVSQLNQLFQRHHTRVAAWCYRLTGDVDTSADLAQEVFLKAFQRLESFRGDSKFTTWLYTIARHHCLDELRSRASSPVLSSETIPEHEDPQALDISAAMERRESEELVRKLMAESLDEIENKVMTLHFVQELSLSSVTRLLNLTNQSGAKAYVVSARRKLSRALALWRSRGEKIGGGSNAG